MSEIQDTRDFRELDVQGELLKKEIYYYFVRD